MKLEKILGSAIVDGRCFVSSVALAKLAASAADVRPLLTLDIPADCARYDVDTATVTVTCGEQTEVVQLEYIPCAHPHPIAEARMNDLDPVALHAPIGAIALIGDSLFHNWANAAEDMHMPGDVVNLGVGGYCIPDLEKLTVPRHVLPIAPRTIVVHVGINDMFQGGVPEAKYLADIKAFFAWLHALIPAARLCFLSIVRPTDIAPTVSGIVGPEADARRDAIDHANAAMRAFCEQHDWTAYLDAEAAYCDNHGRSRVDLFHGDGIHLLPHAYPAWGEAIAAALSRI